MNIMYIPYYSIGPSIHADHAITQQFSLSQSFRFARMRARLHTCAGHTDPHSTALIVQGGMTLCLFTAVVHSHIIMF